MVAIFAVLAIVALIYTEGRIAVNLGVALVAITSSAIFISTLDRKKFWSLSLLLVVIFSLYLALLGAFEWLYPEHLYRNIFLNLLCGVLLLAITIGLKYFPKDRTLVLSAMLTGHRLYRRGNLKKIGGASSPFTESEIDNLISEVVAPFAPAMNLSEIVARDPVPGLHQHDYLTAAKILSKYGISAYSSKSYYKELLDMGIIDRKILDGVTSTPINFIEP